MRWKRCIGRPPASMRRTVLIGAAAWLMSLTAECPAAQESAAFRPLWTAVHVHSTASTGTMSLEALAARAEQLGLDALILSENFTLRYEYGVRPLEGVLKYGVSLPSVLEYGIDRYLADVRAVRDRHPGLLIIPGVEVAPHYYWTGSLATRDLTMHNAQRNVLVIGLERAEDYAVLPARGNPRSFVWDDRSVTNGWPLLLLAPAVWLWVPRQRARMRPNGKPHVRFAAAVGLVLASMTLVAYAWPLASPPYSSYDTEAGYRPYQALIDTAMDKGALVFWSMPDARDFSRHLFGPLGTVTVTTDSHPESLEQTQRYTGFGGLYQDTRTSTLPGGVWDQATRARLTDGGQPPVIIGEAAFHGLEDVGKDLDRVYTVVLARERTAAAVLAALREGRAWTVARGDQRALLELKEFRVADRQSRRAGIGERLETPDPSPSIHVRLLAIDGSPQPVRLRLIREGQVVGSVEGEAPLEWNVLDEHMPADRWVPYRIEVTGKGGELLSNPLYVKRAADQGTVVQ